MDSKDSNEASQSKELKSADGTSEPPDDVEAVSSPDLGHQKAEAQDQKVVNKEDEGGKVTPSSDMASALIQSIDNIPSRDNVSSNDDVPGAVAVSSAMEELRPRFLLTQDMALAAHLSVSHSSALGEAPHVLEPRDEGPEQVQASPMLTAEVAPDINQIVSNAIQLGLQRSGELTQNMNLAQEQDDSEEEQTPPISSSANTVTAEEAPGIDQIVNSAVQQAVQQTLAATRNHAVSVTAQAELQTIETNNNRVKENSHEEEERKILGQTEFVIFIIMTVLLAIIIAVGVAVGISANDGEPTTAASESPSAVPPYSSIPTTQSPLLIHGGVLLPGVNVSAMNQSSPEYKGLHFVANEDLVGLELSRNPRLVERFALAVLYYSTNGKEWTNSFRWVTNVDHCNWFGISCDTEDRVNKIDGTNNTVTGTLPTQMGHLVKLEALWMAKNELTGNLVSELGQLVALTELSLHTNKIRSTLPTELGNLSALQTLSLSSNELFGSTITEIGRLTNLVTVQLSTNSINGPIPTEIGQLSLLQDWSITRNILSSTLPSEIQQLTNMQNLQIWQNQITGTISPNVVLMTSLTSMGFSSNILTGPIPSELGNLPNLETLSLFNNVLSSTIPTSLGNLGTLRFLSIGNNLISSEIPSELGKLTQLLHLRLAGNRLTGTLPRELGHLSQCTYFGVSDNMLSGSIPQSFQQLTSLNQAFFPKNNFTGGLETLFCELDLEFFFADCNIVGSSSPTADLDCGCCTHCCQISVNDCLVKPPLTPVPPTSSLPSTLSTPMPPSLNLTLAP